MRANMSDAKRRKPAGARWTFLRRTAGVGPRAICGCWTGRRWCSLIGAGCTSDRRA